MVDILLIQPPMADYYRTAKRTIPYGLACIAAAATQKGFSVAILDAMATAKSRVVSPPDSLAHLGPFYGRADRSPMALFHHYRHFGYSLEHIGRQVKSSGAFLVGIASLFTAYSDMALAVARTVKANLPGCTVVMGGHHPTALPETVLAEPSVDLVIRGEGETALPALAEALRAGASLDGVPGICYRHPDGSLTVNAPTLVAEPDRMPVPAFDLIRRKFYQRHGLDSLVVTAGRGCPLACSYCATSVHSWMGFRKRLVPAVLAEIRAASTGRRVGFIDFEDENLTMDRAWFLELMAGIGNIFGDHRPELRAMNGLFPPSLDETVVQAMKTVGFTALNLSLGSADREQLRRFHRPDVRAAFDRALQYGRREGLSAVGYIIVGAPDQDPLTSVDDLLFLARRPVLAGVSVFYPAPGSVDYRLCNDLGLLPDTFAAMRATALPIEQRTSRTDSVTLLRLGRILNFIKALLAADIPVPPASPIDARVDPRLDRQALGRKLLAAFLHDGAIRGIDADGTVYRHRVSTRLCQHFLEGLQDGPVSAA
ncbi:B12-binding domain-containing radical SAM protein [Desulfosarcina ovata]|uniref:B12-binding domain-containing radical SAM protein n=1 Tax=Desulfosarcina ovata subsp. ovata TaxID=2752305 RepID=A0A5K8A993_9BACT|nr:radical SAM protein [Desulfosarcina ovata]BBO89117.1 B12-binding domain-containing radical SAM protein [Desulfosarcina ovata subsp. ovata]